jgi:hypothetical protein
MVEVYDNPHPPLRFECVLAIEALASRPWIVFAVIWSDNRRDDCLDVIEQPRAVPLGKMQV